MCVIKAHMVRQAFKLVSHEIPDPQDVKEVILIYSVAVNILFH